MKTECLFIYDGECPFCNHFAELLEIRAKIPSLKLMDGRKNLSQLSALYKQGFDLNNGAILLKDGNVLHGPEAVSWICSMLDDPNDSILSLLKIIFKSGRRSKILFPFLIWSRRLLLTIKGKVWQPVNKNNQFY
tara:strand:+ start:10835 stop:11236 length:402 start_codon:yes stop_codon:yes gene_type:complete